MPIFQPIKPNYTFLKIALHGWKGSGKSFTSVLLAYLIARTFKVDPNKIAYLDTEGRAIDVQEALGDSLGFKINHSTTRSFDTLLKAIDEAKNEYPILIADSITHFWRSFVKGYLKSKNRTRLLIQDHAILQDKWQVFVDTFMNSPIHFISAGRSANVFEDVLEDDEEDDEKAEKKYKLRVTGTKMAVEKEFGYEPGLVFEIQKKFSDHSSQFSRKIIISKDSTSLLEGKVFDCKSYELPRRPNAAEKKKAAEFYVKQIEEFFGPHIEQIAARRGEHKAYETTDHGSFWSSQKKQGPDGKTLAEIRLETIEANFHRIFGGTRGDAAKSLKFFALEKIFRTPSWKAVTELPLTELEIGANITTAMLDIVKAKPDAPLNEELLGKIVDEATDLALTQEKKKPATPKEVPKTEDKPSVLKDIQGVLVGLWPRRDKESQKIKADILGFVFKGKSWDDVKKLEQSELEQSLWVLTKFENLYKPLLADGKEIPWETIAEKLADAKEMVMQTLKPQDAQNDGGLPF